MRVSNQTFLADRFSLTTEPEFQAGDKPAARQYPYEVSSSVAFFLYRPVAEQGIAILL